MSKQIKEVTLYIQATKWNCDKEFEIEVNTCNLKSDNHATYVTLDTKVVNVELPELDEKVLVLAQVEQLQEAIKAEKAEHYLKLTSIEEKIKSLMCLENKTDYDRDDSIPF